MSSVNGLSVLPLPDELSNQPPSISSIKQVVQKSPGCYNNNSNDVNSVFLSQPVGFDLQQLISAQSGQYNSPSDQVSRRPYFDLQFC